MKKTIRVIALALLLTFLFILLIPISSYAVSEEEFKTIVSPSKISRGFSYLTLGICNLFVSFYNNNDITIEAMLRQNSDKLDKNSTHALTTVTVDDNKINGLFSVITADFYPKFIMLAVIVFLVAIIYIGILTIFSTVAEKKANYKQRLVTWTTGLLIVFVFGFIMVFLIKVNNALADTFLNIGKSYYNKSEEAFKSQVKGQQIKTTWWDEEKRNVNMIDLINDARKVHRATGEWAVNSKLAPQEYNIEIHNPDAYDDITNVKVKIECKNVAENMLGELWNGKPIDKFYLRVPVNQRITITKEGEDKGKRIVGTIWRCEKKLNQAIINNQSNLINEVAAKGVWTPNKGNITDYYENSQNPTLVNVIWRKAVTKDNKVYYRSNIDQIGDSLFFNKMYYVTVTNTQTGASQSCRYYLKASSVINEVGEERDIDYSEKSFFGVSCAGIFDGKVSRTLFTAKRIPTDPSAWEDAINEEGDNVIPKDPYLRQLLDEYNTEEHVGRFEYAFLYLVGVLQVLFFLITYVIRTFMISFLIIIFPLVMAINCLDKINDNKSGAFGEWRKEFISQVFINSIHSLSYGIMMAVVLGNADISVVIKVIVLWFVIPSGDLLKGIFNIKPKISGDDNGLAGLAGGMILANKTIEMTNKALSAGKGGSSGGGPNDYYDGDDEDGGAGGGSSGGSGGRGPGGSSKGGSGGRGPGGGSRGGSGGRGSGGGSGSGSGSGSGGRSSGDGSGGGGIRVAKGIGAGILGATATAAKVGLMGTGAVVGTAVAVSQGKKLDNIAKTGFAGVAMGMGVASMGTGLVNNAVNGANSIGNTFEQGVAWNQERISNNQYRKQVEALQSGIQQYVTQNPGQEMKVVTQPDSKQYHTRMVADSAQIADWTSRGYRYDNRTGKVSDSEGRHIYTVDAKTGYVLDASGQNAIFNYNPSWVVEGNYSEALGDMEQVTAYAGFDKNNTTGNIEMVSVRTDRGDVYSQVDREMGYELSYQKETTDKFRKEYLNNNYETLGEGESLSYDYVCDRVIKEIEADTTLDETKRKEALEQVQKIKKYSAGMETRREESRRDKMEKAVNVNRDIIKARELRPYAKASNVEIL